MRTITQVTNAMQAVLTTGANLAAAKNAFVQRVSKLTGAGFVQTLVFGFLANPRATRSQLAASAAALGVTISAQGIDQRMTEAAAGCLVDVLTDAASTMLTADPVVMPVLDRFRAVFIQDSTTIGLPRTLATYWRATGNQHTTDRPPSALKVGVRLNLRDGGLQANLDHALTADRSLAIQDDPIPAVVVTRARWQIELLFRLWKSEALIDTWRSGRPFAILCELYAKLIGVIIQHWLILVSCWAFPDRSLTKASCRINKRKTKPYSYQLFLDLAEARLG
jgi:hypothetical protein